MPVLLSYPRLISLIEAKEIKNVLCYILRHYGRNGLSVLISRQPDPQTKEIRIGTTFGDWNGHCFDGDGDKSALLRDFLAGTWQVLLQTMRLIKLPQAQFYFAAPKLDGIRASELVLVDIQLALNKFAGPGLIRDLFGKVLHVQEAVKIEALDDHTLAAIRDGAGSYASSLIIKPSKFRTVERAPVNHRGNGQLVPNKEAAGGTQPLYVEVLR
jgi:hypothetical protein